MKSESNIFLIYEGSETEVIYFDAVRSLRGDIGNKPINRINSINS